jgi:hypothetical protein
LKPERQLALLWGGVAVLLVGLAPLANRFAFALPACPIKAVVGLPCLSCGTTRAGLALSRLDLVSAFSINPLAALTWVVLVGGGLTAGALALGRKSIKEPDWNLSLPRRWLLVAVLLTNWVYLVGAGI